MQSASIALATFLPRFESPGFEFGLKPYTHYPAFMLRDFEQEVENLEAQHLRRLLRTDPSNMSTLQL